MNLTDLKKLCEAATPEPWVSAEKDVLGYADGSSVMAFDEDNREENTKFIAAARTYLPLLIEVAEAANRITECWDANRRLLPENLQYSSLDPAHRYEDALGLKEALSKLERRMKLEARE